MVSRRQRRQLLGLGLDNDDGHLRVTRGENFHLVGGSEDTHEHMQEKCVKLNERLSAEGKHIDTIDHKELIDLAAECDIHLHTLESKDDA